MRSRTDQARARRSGHSDGIYDFAVIGAGAAGLTAADFVTRLGMRTVLVEQDRIGGDCTWTGCVPSKALVRVARAAHDARIADEFGIGLGPPSVNMPAVRNYLRKCIDQIYRGTTPEALASKGIEVLTGATRFVGRDAVAVGERIIRAKRFLVATGARPVTPPIKGLDAVPHFTYRTFFENERLPRALVVIGGGPVGAEIAQAYRRLGSAVTMVAPKLLPKEDEDVRAAIIRVFEREGIEIIQGRAESVRRDGEELAVSSNAGTARGDMLLVAAGRKPNLEGLDLDKAGVAHSVRGIPVDARFQTNVGTIFAAGDVLDGPQFSHLAAWQAFYAARNALLPFGGDRHADVLPRVTFTDPEVAHVGPSLKEARDKYGADLVVHTTPLEKIDRAVTEDDGDGFVRIAMKQDGTIVAATIVAERAGESLSELCLAISRNMKMGHLATAIHPYPTYSTAVQQIAADLSVERTLASLPGKIALHLAKNFG